MIKFFELISPSIKQKIAFVIFEEPLYNNILFRGIHKYNLSQQGKKNMLTSSVYNMANLEQLSKIKINPEKILKKQIKTLI